jgi:hypothetical protein
MTNSTVWKVATGALIALTLAPIRVEATITSVTVNASRDYENARGYTYAEITVPGTVDRADGSIGAYAVPAVLIYPRHRRANRVGVVDWVNSACYHFFPATTEFGTCQFTLLATEDYLFDEGAPPSRYFRGSVDAIDAFVPMTDDDGHFAGGLRLPHVGSTIHGRVAGAPLGRHTPLNSLGLDPFNPFVFISGTFTRFSDDELLDRYRSREQYVRRVRRAADHLAASGYITHSDGLALIAAAERQPLPEELRCPK